MCKVLEKFPGGRAVLMSGVCPGNDLPYPLQAGFAPTLVLRGSG